MFRIRGKMGGKLAKSKGGQITVFIIIAIAIVAVLLVFLVPDFKGIFVKAEPDMEIKNCAKDAVQEALEIILPRGGSAEPKLYYNYNNEPVEYTCYTNEYYKQCVMQKPLLKQSIESEIEKYAQPKIKLCVNNMIKNLEGSGFDVKKAGSEAVDVQIIPGYIKASVDLEIATEKGGEKRVYDKFIAGFESEIYDIIMIAYSISEWETRYGDSSPDAYMAFYPSLKVEKQKQPDSTTIYIITNRDTKEVFQFASRSLAWPPGY